MNNNKLVIVDVLIASKTPLSGCNTSCNIIFITNHNDLRKSI